MPAIASVHIRALTRADVDFELTVHAEDTPVRGNALASGDDAVDKECEDGILARLDRGDEWAWCTVKVTARWNGYTAHDYLGCCSYEDEREFRAGEYFADMCETALDGLNAQIKTAAETLVPLLLDEAEHHFCYGSGMPGCLYDWGPNFADTRESAIDDVLTMFGDSLAEGEEERLRANLLGDGIHYFEDPQAAGAVYVDVTKHAGPCPENDE